MMAEGKGANIARLVSKQAGRAKEKVATFFQIKINVPQTFFLASQVKAQTLFMSRSCKLFKCRGYVFSA